MDNPEILERLEDLELSGTDGFVSSSDERLSYVTSENSFPLTPLFSGFITLCKLDLTDQNCTVLHLKIK